MAKKEDPEVVLDRMIRAYIACLQLYTTAFYDASVSAEAKNRLRENAAAAQAAANRALWRADFAIWRANRANAAAARQWRAAAEAARKREACVVSLEEVNAFDAQRNRFAERTAPGRESRQRPS